MGPEGFEPPPTGLKGRHAAATPRPRVTYGLPGFSFDPGHDLSPRYEFCSRQQPVWESNPPLRLERAVSWADRRTGRLLRVGRGALESPSAGLQPAAKPSQLPTHFRDPNENEKARCLRHTGPETPHEGCLWPGVTSAGDRDGAGSPMDRRIASLLDNPGSDADSRRTWTTSVQEVSQADWTRLDAGPTSRLARRLVPLQTRHPGRMFARFQENVGVARGNFSPQGFELVSRRHVAVRVEADRSRRSESRFVRVKPLVEDAPVAPGTASRAHLYRYSLQAGDP
jgi:hypothetical protein